MIALGLLGATVVCVDATQVNIRPYGPFLLTAVIPITKLTAVRATDTPCLEFELRTGEVHTLGPWGTLGKRFDQRRLQKCQRIANVCNARIERSN